MAYGGAALAHHSSPARKNGTHHVTPTSRFTIVADPRSAEVDIDPGAAPTPAVGAPAPPAARPATALGRLRPLTGRPLAPVVLWTVAAVCALGARDAHMLAAPAIGVFAAGCALALLPGRLAGRLVTAVAMTPVAFAATAPSIAWVLAAALVAGVAATTERPLVARSQDLQRHLDWCRRREERAHVLVVAMPEAHDESDRGLLEAFRLTDNVSIVRRHDGCEVHAVVDDHRLSRDGLERRIVQEVGASARFGWAAFPDDGYTLEVLLERATAQLGDGAYAATGLGRLDAVQQPA